MRGVTGSNHLLLGERVRAMHAIGAERLRYRLDVAIEGGAEVQVPVRIVAECERDRRHAAEIFARKGVAAGRGGRIFGKSQRAAPDLCRREAGREIGKGHVEVAAVAVDGVEAALDLGDARPVALDDALGARRIEHVVGVEQDDELAGAVLEAEIESRGLAAILLAERRDASGVAVNDGGRIVGRAVIDDDDLGIGPGLCQRAVDRRT